MVYIRGPGKVLLRLMVAVLVSALFLVNITGTAQADAGTISGVIDTSVFDGTRGWEPSIVHISGDIYALAYEGADSGVDGGNDGFLKTVEIGTDGDIKLVQDTFEFDTTQGTKPDLIHVTGDIYAIAYEGSGDDGILKTVEIATDGQITEPVEDTLIFDSTKGKYPEIINISSNVFIDNSYLTFMLFLCFPIRNNINISS